MWILVIIASILVIALFIRTFGLGIYYIIIGEDDGSIRYFFISIGAMILISLIFYLLLL